MLFSEFNRGATDLVSMILPRFERDKTLVFTIQPQQDGQGPVQFALWRPSNYTTVLTDHPRAFESWGDRRDERRVDGEWWRICDHDSCWRDNWNYNIAGFPLDTQVTVLNVALFGGEPLDQEGLRSTSKDERWLRLLEGEPVWSSLDLCIQGSSAWQATLVDLLFRHWGAIGHDPQEASFEFDTYQQTGHKRKLTRVLHYQWVDGKPVFQGWSAPRKPPHSGRGSGSVVGDLHRFVLSSWSEAPEVTLNTPGCRCTNVPFGGWPH